MIEINKIKNEHTTQFHSQYDYYNNLRVYHSENIDMIPTGSNIFRFQKTDGYKNIDCILVVSTPGSIYDSPPNEATIFDSMFVLVNSNQYTERFLKSEFKRFSFDTYQIICEDQK